MRTRILEPTWLSRFFPGMFQYLPLFGVIVLLGCSSGGDVKKGAACLRLGDYQMAIEFFSSALKRDPQRADARLGLGKALLQKSVDTDSPDEWKRALVHLEAARTLTKDPHTTRLLSEAWTHRARHLLETSDTVTALDALSRAIEYAPRNIEPLNLAGILYFRLGYTDRAGALFTKASLIDTTHPSAYFNLGMIAWQTGDFKPAHESWLSALKRAPQDEDILYWFALAEKKIREIPAQ